MHSLFQQTPSPSQNPESRTATRFNKESLNAENTLQSLNDLLATMDPKSRIGFILEIFKGTVIATTSAGIGSRVVPQLFHEIDKEAEPLIRQDNIKQTPFVFIDTGDLFDSTLGYAQNIQTELGLNLIRVSHKLTPQQFLTRSQELNAEGFSHNDVFDRLTKVEVLKAVIDNPEVVGLRQVYALIAGNRRADSASRKDLPFLEKKNGIFYAYPLADLSDKQVEIFFNTRKIEDHPLKSLGYSSLGNRFDTRVQKAGDKDAKASRHGGEKTECGCHTLWPAANAEIAVLTDWKQRVISPRVIPQRLIKKPQTENTSSLTSLEAETSHILLETVASFERVALMFSAGKDSACIAHVAKKLFRRSDGEISIPFEFFHYDSSDNFPEVLEFRDRIIKELSAELKIFEVNQAYSEGYIKTPPNDHGSVHSLVELINFSQQHYSMDALIGGGRRDEDPVRAKERIFSLRDKDGKWQPHNQRPEVWNIYNTQMTSGQHMRVFPISNWTELNVWEYIAQENVDLPSIYFAHRREVFKRNGVYLAYFEDTELRPGETVELKTVRCRSIGDRKTTGFFESSALTPHEVLEELQKSEYSERSGRAEDVDKSTAMESRKEAGWF